VQQPRHAWTGGQRGTSRICAFGLLFRLAPEWDSSGRVHLYDNFGF